MVILFLLTLRNKTKDVLFFFFLDKNLGSVTDPVVVRDVADLAVLH